MTGAPELGSEIGSERILAIDYVKALAIVAVAFTHAGIPPWDPNITSYDRVLSGFWVQFHVPAFLLLSGFLYYRSTEISFQRIRARMVRVLIPYLIASSIVQIAGFSDAKDVRDVLFQLATGSALGIYYFIFLLVSFIPTLWLLSRMSRRAALIALACILATSFCLDIYIQILLRGPDPPHGSIFWLVRNPFNYSYSMFIGGWVAAAYLPQLQRTLEGHRTLIGVLCLIGIGIWTAIHVWRGPLISSGIFRLVYTLSMIVGLILLTYKAHPIHLVRFLSDSTLALYLYHNMFQIMAQPYVTALHPLIRILTLVLIGLLGSSALCLVGRRLLGSRARTLLGA